MEILFLTLPIENVFWLAGIKVRAQNFPLFILLSALLFSLLVYKLKLGIIGKFFLFFFLYGNISSFLSLIFAEIDYRLFLRMNLSLLIGLNSFLILKYLFSSCNLEKIDKYIFLSYIIVFIVGIWQFIRKEYRVYSTFTEPKHLGLFLILVYLFWFELRKKYYSLKKRFIIYGVFVFLLITTFSTTAYLVFIIYLVISSVYSGNKKDRYVSVVLLLLLLVLFLYLVNLENYFSRMVKYTLTVGTNIQNQTGTFIDNFSVLLYYMNLGNITDLNDIVSFIFGSGMGQERSYIALIGESYFSKISSMKAYGVSFIPSLFGKIQSYAGFFGIVIFVLTNVRLIKKVLQNDKETNALEYNERMVIVTFLITLQIIFIFSLGTFQGIENWFIYSYVEYKLGDRIQHLDCSLQLIT